MLEQGTAEVFTQGVSVSPLVLYFTVAVPITPITRALSFSVYHYITFTLLYATSTQFILSAVLYSAAIDELISPGLS